MYWISKLAYDLNKNIRGRIAMVFSLLFIGTGMSNYGNFPCFIPSCCVFIIDVSLFTRPFFVFLPSVSTAMLASHFVPERSDEVCCVHGQNTNTITVRSYSHVSNFDLSIS
jgi:hypothetical protein